jgi:hypothetical protein
VRYTVAATLARSADGGAAVGLVLLATTPAAHLARPAFVGGLLATCLTGPHLLGPAIARQLDRARDGRRLLAAAFCVYGFALAAAVVAVGRAPIVVAASLVAVAGSCGPLLTGGLSSRLAALVGPGEGVQRRAQGWDAVSYGVGTTAGPAAVAGLAAVTNAYVSVLSLSAAAVLAAGLVLALPRAGDGQVPVREVLTVRRALGLIATSGPLRRVTYTTMIAAIPGGAVPVIAVVLGGHLGAGSVAGAVLVAAFGSGNFAGSLLLTIVPLTGEPERLTSRYATAMGLAFGLCAAAPNYALAIIAFGLAGAANAALFTATLAARSTYAPPTARAQVFVSTAALKIATATLGTALAGAFVDRGARVLLLAGAVATLTATTATVVERNVRRAAPGRQRAGVAAGTQR